jgi:hypothetical protein
MDNYNTIFSILHTHNRSRQITNFIEIYCVMSGVRPACLLSLEEEQVKALRVHLRIYGVYIVPYRGGVNYLIVNGNYSKIENIKFLRNSTELTSEVHRITGEVLGYITPFNIKSSVQDGEKKNAELQVNVFMEHNSKEYSIQIAPQKVIDTRNEDIQIYYGRISNQIMKLNELYLPFSILSTKTNIWMTRGGSRERKGGKESR